MEKNCEKSIFVTSWNWGSRSCISWWIWCAVWVIT